MELVQYLLVIVICLSAIPAGMFIGYLARPEIAPGVRWFNWLQKILILAMVIIGGVAGLFTPLVFAIVTVMAFLLLLPGTSVFLSQIAPGTAIFFPLFLFASRRTDLIGAFATIVVLFHLVQGTLWIGRKDRRIRFAIINSVTFASLSIAPLFL